MKKLRVLLLTAALSTLPFAAQAMVENDYDPDNLPGLTAWYGPVDAAARQADLDFIKGMRPHHAGALTMSGQYLADPKASSPRLKALAKGIIRNQTFEIAILDSVKRHLEQAPERSIGGPVQPIGAEGHVQQQRFMRSPVPGPMDGSIGPVSRRDVEFAKAMIVHHQAAVDMARDYHANPAVRDSYLDLMNVDIILDQSQEIALMRRIIAAYPGNPDDVKVDPSMIHGMEGMKHGGMAGHH